MLDAGPDVLAWERTLDGDRLIAAINFAETEAPLECAAGASLVVSTDPDRSAGPVETLGPSEAVVLRG
jgi:alpha-glucosidase